MRTLVRGEGLPVTVVAHGLGASVAETRPLLRAVAGTKVFYEARGHDGTPLPPGPCDYATLAGDLEEVAAAHGATQAVAVSMGAGALLSLWSRQPAYLERSVLLLPPSLDVARPDRGTETVVALAEAVAAGDRDRVVELALLDLPADVAATPVGAAYAAARADVLVGLAELPELVRQLRHAVPVADRSTLAAVTAEVLVLAQEDDPLHPAQVARELVGLLPRSHLVLLGGRAAVVTERATVQRLIGEFLSPT